MSYLLGFLIDIELYEAQGAKTGGCHDVQLMPMGW